MDDQASSKARFYGLRSLFNNWIFSVGCVALLVFLGQYIDKMLFPGLVLLFQFILMRRSHRQTEKALVCNLLPHVMSRVLFFSVIIMVLINFYYLKLIDPAEFDDGRANPYLPYITVLIVSPVSMVVVAWAMWRRKESIFCRSCRLTYGHIYEHGYMGQLLSKESRYQLRLLLVVSFAITVYAWTYYAIRYSNASLNSSDRFYFNWIPFVLYLVSLFYMVMRYWSLFAFLEKNIYSEGLPKQSATLIRYIVLCEDKILLKESMIDGNNILDTPVARQIDATTRLDVSDARKEFDNVCRRRFENIVVRVLYQTHRQAGHGNIYHVLVQIPSRTLLEGTPFSEGVWLTAYQMSNALDDGNIRPILAAEIHRVYTIAMAYKAYDRSGMRRYSIRHYKPLFNLGELIGLDVNFDDPAWLIVARDNQDRPFFRIRRFWKKYVSGVEV